jgi:ubiquinone/menaquinone biosynthesis C-methylase UbiE
MSKECSKALMRRLSNPNFMRLYFRGKGLDIGSGSDSLSQYTELFPLVERIDSWDKENGDAQYLNGIENNTYDFVHSSHCLEHLDSPYEALRNWFRIIKSGGYLVITMPDEDKYEQGQFPSTFNKNHKWTFTIWKETSWSNNSISILNLVKVFNDEASIEKIELLNHTYLNLPRQDQTLLPTTECGIEIIIRKV